MMIEKECPFCNNSRTFIAEADSCFAIFDAFPVNEGHALIIPKRHTANYFDLTEQEQFACIALLNKVKKMIQLQFKPQGFNIGINVNEVAGQSIPHVHIHLIPRYSGDVEQPRGGVRGVIPDKRDY